jgi:adenylate kinase
MIELIKTRLAQPDTEGGFILDGFPRTTVQAEELARMFSDIGRSFNVVFALQIPDEVALERLAQAGRDRGPGRRHRRVDPAPARELPPRDQAAGRALPRAG